MDVGGGCKVSPKDRWPLPAARHGCVALDNFELECGHANVHDMMLGNMHHWTDLFCRMGPFGLFGGWFAFWGRPKTLWGLVGQSCW